VVYFSEKRPARSDLIVLVAHNDDPTGELKLMSLGGGGGGATFVLQVF
jgi:hypothetical protein